VPEHFPGGGGLAANPAGPDHHHLLGAGGRGDEGIGLIAAAQVVGRRPGPPRAGAVEPFPVGLAAKVGPGQRRAVVGPLGLVAEQQQPAAEALGP
jgi:hypothetical protein